MPFRHLLFRKRGDASVHVQWQLENLTDIREVVIVRKRYTSLIETDDPQPFQTAAEVLNAADREGRRHP